MLAPLQRVVALVLRQGAVLPVPLALRQGVLVPSLPALVLRQDAVLLVRRLVLWLPVPVQRRHVAAPVLWQGAVLLVLPVRRQQPTPWRLSAP